MFIRRYEQRMAALRDRVKTAGEVSARCVSCRWVLPSKGMIDGVCTWCQAPVLLGNPDAAIGSKAGKKAR